MAETTAYTTEQFEAGDGYPLSYRVYAPAASPRARLVFLHGIQSHAGWYEHSCTQLSAAGFHVSFLDRRGSGANAQDRGDARHYARLVDDVAEFLTHAPVPGQDGSREALPTYVAGISWGGKVAIALERRHPGLTHGLMLLCPGIFARIGVGLGQKLRIAWSRWFRPRKLFPIPLNDPELFTATPKWLDFLRGDALALHRATARFLFESARLDRYLRRAARYVHVPVLLLLAGRDRIINNEKTRAYVERFATPSKEIIEYPDAHHTLEFEPEPDSFIRDMIAWLERQLASREAGPK